MKITDALLGEHAVIYALLDHVEKVLPALEDLAVAKALGAELAAAILSHAQIEDEVLFPALDPHLGQGGPLAVMREEHEEIHGILTSLPDSATPNEARDSLEMVIQVARDHFAKEEHALFSMALQFLAEDELESLGARWGQMRNIET